MLYRELLEQARFLAGVADTRVVPPAVQARCVNEAIEAVTLEACELDPQYMEIVTRFTYEADALSVDLDGKLVSGVNGALLKLNRLGELERDEDRSVDNEPSWISMSISASESGGPVLDTPVPDIDATLRAQGFGVPGWGSRRIGRGGVLGAQIKGGKLWLMPTPSLDLYLYAEWVPFQVYTGADHQVMGGAISPIQRAVLYATATGLARQLRDKDAAGEAQALYQEAIGKLPSFIHRKTSVGGYPLRGHPDYK